MTARDAITGSLVALTIVAAPGLAEALGTALTGVPTFSTPVGEAAPVWTKPRTALREASRSRQPARTGTLNWHALALCESSNNPLANTGNGYYGLYQFDLRTWHGVGGRGLPSDASRAEQTRRAQLLYAERGAQPWPECGRYLQ